MGHQHPGELAALPEVQLITRMGQAGRQLRLRSRGELPHFLQPVEEPLALMEVLELDEPVETLEPLLFCINPMLEQIILRAQLHAVALAAISITLWLQQECDRTLGEEEQTAAAISTPIAISKSAPNSADQPLYPKIALRSAAPRHPRKELPLVESTGKPRMPTKTAPLPTPIRSKSAPSSNPLPALAQADPGKQIAFVRTIRRQFAPLIDRYCSRC